MLKWRRWRNAAHWLTLIAFLYHAGPPPPKHCLSPIKKMPHRVPTGHLVGTFCHFSQMTLAWHQKLTNRADKAENSSFKRTCQVFFLESPWELHTSWSWVGVTQLEWQLSSFFLIPSLLLCVCLRVCERCICEVCVWYVCVFMCVYVWCVCMCDVSVCAHTRVYRCSFLDMHVMEPELDAGCFLYHPPPY